MSLDSLAWRPNSPVWDAVRAEGSLPGVQEVSFPSQLEGDGYAPPATTVLSPMMNPALRRVAGGALTPVHRGTNVHDVHPPRVNTPFKLAGACQFSAV